MANGGIIGPVKVVCTSSTKVTTFTSSGTFQKKNCTSTIPEVMVVAGGGAGGGPDRGGGGGAGGYRTATCVTAPTGAITVTVGGGATQPGNASGGTTNQSGNASTCLTITSAGGG